MLCGIVLYTSLHAVDYCSTAEAQRKYIFLQEDLVGCAKGAPVPKVQRLLLTARLASIRMPPGQYQHG